MSRTASADEDLVEAIYAGAATPDGLRQALSQAVARVEAGGGNIHVVDKATLASVLFLPTGPSYNAQSIDAYFSHWRHINVHRAAMRRAGGVFLCHEHLAPETLARAPYAQDFYFAMGERWLAGAVAHADPDYEISLVFNRRADAEPFGEDARRLIADVLPHIRRAAAIAVSGGFRQALESGVNGALSASQQPVWLIDANLKIYWANHAAVSYLSGTDAMGEALLSERGGRLHLDSDDQTAALKAFAAAACARRLEAALTRTLRLRGIATGLDLEVLPTTVPDGALRGAAALAMVVARPVGLRPQAAELMRELYKLTRIEAQLAVAVAAGVDLDQIALTRGVSIETVRTQMRAIYAKTATTRQAELACLVWRTAS